MLPPREAPPAVPVPEELRLLAEVLNEPVRDYLARQQGAGRALEAERERWDEELQRRVGLPPFD